MTEAATPLLNDAYTSSSALVVLGALSVIPAPTVSLIFDVLFGLSELVLSSSESYSNSLSSRAITEFVSEAELE